MYRQALTALTGALLVSGCAAHSPVPQVVPPSAAVQWVDGPTPDVRTLLLRPASVGAVEGAGHRPAALDVGAFFARYDRAAGGVDQLALMIEVEGIDVPGLLRRSRELLLEVDGELFVGQPGLTENSFRVDLADDSPRATVVIPVTTEILEQIAEAEVVRGRLGLWASFTLPEGTRARFRELLEALPEGAESTELRASQLRRVTDID